MQLVETFADLMSELSESNNLITAQINTGLDREEVVESLFQSWSSRLASVGRLTGQQKTEVTTTLSAGPWSNDQKKELARVVLKGKSDAAQPGAK